MIGWHHQLNGHEFEQAPEIGDGQGGMDAFFSIYYTLDVSVNIYLSKQFLMVA